MTPPADHFEVFGLPRRLTISTEELQSRFYELSRELHPDRFARKPEEERQRALAASSALNDAYRTLRDPVKRAEHLLLLEGFNIGEQRSKDVPPELLEEVFELNMALEEMRGGEESARPQLKQAEGNFQSMLAESDEQLERLAASYDMQPSRDTLAAIRALLNRRRYLRNLVREVTEALA